MENATISRRELLIAVGWLTASGILLQGCGRRQDNLPEQAESSLKELFPQIELAIRAGHAVRENPAYAQDASKLWTRLFPGSDWEIARKEGLPVFLDRRIRADFENARSLWVGKWLMSETEATLLALVALDG